MQEYRSCCAFLSRSRVLPTWDPRTHRNTVNDIGYKSAIVLKAGIGT